MKSLFENVKNFCSASFFFNLLPSMMCEISAYSNSIKSCFTGLMFDTLLIRMCYLVCYDLTSRRLEKNWKPQKVVLFDTKINSTRRHFSRKKSCQYGLPRRFQNRTPRLHWWFYQKMYTYMNVYCKLWLKRFSLSQMKSSGGYETLIFLMKRWRAQFRNRGFLGYWFGVYLKRGSFKMWIIINQSVWLQI